MAGFVGHAASELEELDAWLVVWSSSPPPGGGGVGRGIGFVQGPLHPGGGMGTGVIPPMMPTSSGRHGWMIRPNSSDQKLRSLHRFLSPGGPVAVASGESLLGGTGTVVSQVGVDVSGPVNVMIDAPGGGMMSCAVKEDCETGIVWRELEHTPAGQDASYFCALRGKRPVDGRAARVQHNCCAPCANGLCSRRDGEARGRPGANKCFRGRTRWRERIRVWKLLSACGKGE